jgi:hypothetical protein
MPGGSLYHAAINDVRGEIFKTLKFVFLPFSEHESYLKKKLCSWNFLPLDLTEQDLIHCVYLIFEQVLALPELHHLVLTRGNY